MQININGQQLTANMGDAHNSESFLLWSLTTNDPEALKLELPQLAINRLDLLARRECFRIANLLHFNGHGATMIYNEIWNQINQLRWN